MRTRGRLAAMVARSWRSARGTGSASRRLTLSRPSRDSEPAIADGGEAVAGQAAFRGARRLIECGGDLGYENLPVGRQIEALVGLVAGLLPVPVVVEQIPEGDVVAALRQEQAAGAQGVADRERERGFPDGAVELAVGDQIGSPVTLHEAVRVIRRQ